MTRDNYSWSLSLPPTDDMVLAIKAQNQQNKRNIVLEFLNNWYDQVGYIPDVEFIQDYHPYMYLDQDLIKDAIESFKAMSDAE